MMRPQQVTLCFSRTHHRDHSVAAESATNATLATKSSGSGQNTKTNSITKLRIESATNVTLATKYSGSGQNMKTNSITKLRTSVSGGTVELASGSNESDTSKSKQVGIL